MFSNSIFTKYYLKLDFNTVFQFAKIEADSRMARMTRMARRFIKLLLPWRDVALYCHSSLALSTEIAETENWKSCQLLTTDNPCLYGSFHLSYLSTSKILFETISLLNDISGKASMKTHSWLQTHSLYDYIYLTIIRRRRSEYWWIFPETKSRGIFTNIYEPEANDCFSIITQVIIEILIKQRNVKF